MPDLTNMTNDTAYTIVHQPRGYYSLRERLAAHAYILRDGVPGAGPAAVQEQCAKALATICEVLLEPKP